MQSFRHTLSLVPLNDGPKSGMAVCVCVLFPSYKDVGYKIVLYASFYKKISVWGIWVEERLLCCFCCATKTM